MRAGADAARRTVHRIFPAGAASIAWQNLVRPWAKIMGAGDERDAVEEDGGEEVLEMDEEIERKAAQEDRREVRKLADPRKPTQSEVVEHEMTHIPYRSWCPTCVRCRGKDLDHRKSVEEDRGVSEFAFDYCFLGDEDGNKLTVLVGCWSGTAK